MSEVKRTWRLRPSWRDGKRTFIRIRSRWACPLKVLVYSNEDSSSEDKRLLVNKMRIWLADLNPGIEDEKWIKNREREDLYLEKFLLSQIYTRTSSVSNLQRKYLIHKDFTFLLNEDPSEALEYLRGIFSRAKARGISMTSSKDELGLKKISRAIFKLNEEWKSVGLPFSDTLSK